MAESQEDRGRVVVAGATGYLGRHVVDALVGRGFRVRALARQRSRLGDAARRCDGVFVGEATRPETLAGLFEGAGAAFSSIGIRHFRRHPTFEEVDFRANINLVEAAERAGVERFAFVSVVDGPFHRKMSAVIDARERVVERLRASSMRAIILRPTSFFNDMGDYFTMARKGRAWLIGSGGTRINPIRGADLADVVSDALSSADPSPELAASGPEVFTQQDIAALTFRVLGKPPRYGHVSPRLLRAIAALARPLNPNAWALLRMFSAFGVQDGVAPCFGTRRLEDYFRELASGAAA